MPLPAILAAGGALASIASGYFANRAANRQANRVKDGFDQEIGSIDALLAQVQGRNTDQEGLEMARQSGLGFDLGAFESSSAIRGAGKNTYGALMGIAQQDGQRRLGQAGMNNALQLGNQQFGQMDALLRQRGMMRGQSLGMQSDLRGQGTSALWGTIGNLGGMAAGYGMNSLLGGPPSPGPGGYDSAMARHAGATSAANITGPSGYLPNNSAYGRQPMRGTW